MLLILYPLRFEAGVSDAYHESTDEIWNWFVRDSGR